MKKMVLAMMIAAALVVAPFGSYAAQPVEIAPPAAEEILPAEADVSEAMSPALHGVVMAMLNQNFRVFDAANRTLAWESLYNMLSLYGQLDERSEYQGDDLLVMSETVNDYAAAIMTNVTALGQMPEQLADRMSYDGKTDCYLVTCGEDALSQMELTFVEMENGLVTLEGKLVYEVDSSVLASFTAQLQSADNMFGWTLVSLVMN